MAGNTSVRNIAWQLLLDTLDAVAVNSGYWTTPTILELEPPDPDATGGPWIVVSLGTEEVVDEPSVGKRYHMEWTIDLDCYVVKDASAAASLFKITQDVRRAIGAFADDSEELFMARITVGGGSMHEGTLHEVSGLVSARETAIVSYTTTDAW